MDLKQNIHDLANRFFEDAVKWRRQIHVNPELAFNEHETAKLITDVLDDIGIDYNSKIAKTGIVAIIEGNNPKSKTIALRADMDALPIYEENEVSYKSKNEGNNACMRT